AVVDARHGISDQDLSLINFAIKNGRALVLAVNKWDGMTEEDRIQVKQDLKRKLYFLQDYVDIHYISALYGTKDGKVY
ncbi:GTP-binding protein, partial [Francisella tularensis]|uniref:GTP-binding protein n=1 Tax=Francisella tularensis TaxID=263 RepID=UPI0023AB9E3B|nr:ribosome biogenesis GTPase Der [Francisella tularensis subsp. holarctica]